MTSDYKICLTTPYGNEFQQIANLAPIFYLDMILNTKAEDLFKLNPFASSMKTLGLERGLQFNDIKGEYTKSYFNEKVLQLLEKSEYNKSLISTFELVERSLEYLTNSERLARCWVGMDDITLKDYLDIEPESIPDEFRYEVVGFTPSDHKHYIHPVEKPIEAVHVKMPEVVNSHCLKTIKKI